MPPLPAVGPVIKLNLRGNSGEAVPIPWTNGVYLRYSGGAPTVAELGTFSADIVTAYIAWQKSLKTSDAVLTEIELIDLSSAMGASYIAPESEAGTRTGAILPASAAALITYPITRRYRGGHPRNYLMVGAQADLLDAAHWTTDFVAEYQTKWNSFINAILGGVYGVTTIVNQCNVSYYFTNYAFTPPKRDVRLVPLIDDFLIAPVAHQQLATQRRRVGRHRS